MVRQVTVSLLKSKETVFYEYDKSGAHMCVWVYALDDKKPAKKISTAVFELTRDNKWFATHVQVLPRHKRKGVASVMYNLVQSEINGELVPSIKQSDEAQMFWQHRLDTIQK